MTDKTKKTAPSLMKQVGKFMQSQLEQAERKRKTEGCSLLLQAKRPSVVFGRMMPQEGENLTMGKPYKILGFLSPHFLCERNNPM